MTRDLVHGDIDFSILASLAAKWEHEWERNMRMPTIQAEENEGEGGGGGRKRARQYPVKRRARAHIDTTGRLPVISPALFAGRNNAPRRSAGDAMT